MGDIEYRILDRRVEVSKPLIFLSRDRLCAEIVAFTDGRVIGDEKTPRDYIAFGKEWNYSGKCIKNIFGIVTIVDLAYKILGLPEEPAALERLRTIKNYKHTQQIFASHLKMSKGTDLVKKIRDETNRLPTEIAPMAVVCRVDGTLDDFKYILHPASVIFPASEKLLIAIDPYAKVYGPAARQEHAQTTPRLVVNNNK